MQVHQGLLPPAATALIQKGAMALGCTPLPYHLTVFQILLIQLLGMNELLIGFGDPDCLSNEPIKVLPMYLKTHDEQSFRDVVSGAKVAVLDAVQKFHALPVAVSDRTDKRVQSVVQVIFSYIPKHPENTSQRHTSLRYD
jgi:hypothetical protein